MVRDISKENSTMEIFYSGTLYIHALTGMKQSHAY